MNPNPPVLTASHVMQREVLTLSPDQEILDAVQRLLARDISGAPVVVDGRVVAMFSERDCLAIVASAAYDDEPSGYVRDYMRTSFLAVGPDTDLFEVTSLFRDSPARRVPVLDRAGRLLGVVTRFDLMRGLQQIHRSPIASAPHQARTPYEKVAEYMSAF